MIREYFRVLNVDLATGMGDIVNLEGRDTVAGGSGLAALLFEKYGLPERPWDDPQQPLIFAIGPLTGYFPLMSKTVCAFKSPYHDQYAESHAGGRSAYSLRFADLDALVIQGKAAVPSCLSVGSRHLDLKDARYLWGLDVFQTGQRLRNMSKGTGHRSIWRIGPAGENLSAFACINVDTYRHFGRLGCGAVMGAKNLKGIVVLGDSSFPLPEGKEYAKLFKEVHEKMTTSGMMDKYHNLGTPINMAHLNGLSALPIRNLQKTTDPEIEGISGETFARDTLLRNTACSGCPVGCIHIAFVREKFMDKNQYLYRQVTYDHEPIACAGAMLHVTDAFSVLAYMDTVERCGQDIISAGIALAWATEALEKGLISTKETIVPLKFGDGAVYRQAFEHLGTASNDFYRLLGQGTMKAAEHYGGQDFACVLGQEMAGYATGEAYFVSQALGFRHSHLDTAAYGYDENNKPKEVPKVLQYYVQEEQDRALLTSLVTCLFARGVYGDHQLTADCLNSLGYKNLAENLDAVGKRVQKMRWQLRAKTGFDPGTVKIPKRFKEIVTWRGPIDESYLDSLQKAYAQKIREMGKPEEEGSPAKN